MTFGNLADAGLCSRRLDRPPAAVAAECRGDDHRRSFAVQLCWPRARGRFLDDYRQAPVKIVSHLSRQLGLPPVLFLDRPGRAQTERTQALRIRRHLGLRPFDGGVAADLRQWLRQGAIEGRTVAELVVRAEKSCAAGTSCCRPPARSTGWSRPR